MKTTSLKLKDLKRNWYVIDCTGAVLGRLASKVSKILQGKHKNNYAANLNNGDKVILINTAKIVFTGNKIKDKLYRKHSGYLGNLKEKNLAWMLKKNPNAVVRHAVYKMLPKNRLRDDYITNLYCYVDENHKHQAQKPIKIDIEEVYKV